MATESHRHQYLLVPFSYFNMCKCCGLSSQFPDSRSAMVFSQEDLNVAMKIRYEHSRSRIKNAESLTQIDVSRSIMVGGEAMARSSR